MLDLFSLGMPTVLGAIAAPGLVAAGLAFRRVEAYLMGREYVDRPLGAWLAMGVLIGALAGSFWHNSEQRADACKAVGKPILVCFPD